MELESYFDFVNENAIRIKGSRVGIEQVIRDYSEGSNPEEIVLDFPTLSLEEVYATITYYLANREKIDDYIQRVTLEAEAAWQEQQRNPSEHILALRKRIAQQSENLRKQDSPLFSNTNR